MRLQQAIAESEQFEAEGKRVERGLRQVRERFETAFNNAPIGVAGLLKQRLRQTDTISRVGGDEFAVLLTQTDADEVRLVADELVKALSQEAAMMADQTIRITASVGVAMIKNLRDVEVLAYADQAMYEAKETGRDRYEIYRPLSGGHERVSARLAESERIREALAAERLLLYCQPILDLATGSICQHELLLRLPDGEKGAPVPPSAFLYRAERSGLIQATDGWVVRQAIALIAAHEQAGHRLVLHVNLSGKSIGDRELAAHTERALAESGIDPTCMIFELTETAAIANFGTPRPVTEMLQVPGRAAECNGPASVCGL